MATPTRTVDAIVQDAINFIQSRQPSITTLPGSVVNDVVISSPAQEFENVYTELTRVSQIMSLDNPDVMTTDELNSLGDNFGLIRNGGTIAQTFETFRVVGLQTTEPNINIPVGTVVTTQQTSTAPIVAFVTTQAGTFISAQAAAYYNSATGFYELTLPVHAQSVGASGNVSAGAVRVLSSGVSRIFAVINTVAATGGTDQESNDDYAARIKLKLAGNNLGTVDGIKSLALLNTGVRDVSVAGPNDVEMLRNEFGGSIDIYILGSFNVSATDTNNYTTAGPQTFILINQPATVTSGSLLVQGTAGGAPKVFVETVDYDLIQDLTTLFNGSIKLQNGMKFRSTGTKPDNGTQFTITYTYNQLIQTLQNTFSSDSNHIVASDVLVKQAQAAIVSVAASIAVISGFSTSDVVSSAQTAVTNFLVTNKLGETFSQSQIVAAIEDTPGVSEVDLTSLVITKNSVPITTQTVTIDKTQYVTVSSINLSAIL